MSLLNPAFPKLLPIIFLGLLLMVIAAIALKKFKPKKNDSPIKARCPVTKNEQPMFFRLTEAFPENIVLAQVAFSALLETKNRATRNRFDRKTTDFVICTKTFEVMAIIELDDSSHNGREEQDKSRISLLTNTGYKVLRYKKMPNLETVQKDVLTPH